MVGSQVSPINRNHMWMENGMALYSEALWTEHEKGATALEQRMKDLSITALTVDNVPLIQTARLEDYSPEYWALSADKGAAVVQMLRSTMGDEKFFQALKSVPAAERVEIRPPQRTSARRARRRWARNCATSSSSGWSRTARPSSSWSAPFSAPQKGFRVQGKISQDLDTFRMPVDLQIETEGNPEDKRIEVMGTSSEFSVDTFGKPKKVILDPGQ